MIGWRAGGTAVITLGLLLGACGGDDDDGDGGAATTDGATTVPVTTVASTAPASAPTTAPSTTASTTTPATTVVATTAPATTAPATTTTAPLEGVVLRGDGLGIVSFGEPSDEVIDTLTARFGPPTEVGEWMETGLSPDAPPPCNFVEQQVVQFGDLAILNGTEPDGSRRFRYFAYTAFEGGEPFPPDLETEQGIGLLDTIESAVAVVPGIEWSVSEPATWYDAGNDLFGELITDRGVLIASITGGDICAG